MSKLQIIGLTAASVAVGTIYVLVHEARRKRKKADKAAREAPISKEMLLKILNKSAEASKTVIERIRVEVKKIQQQRNLPDDQALLLFQQNFEHSLDQLIGAIRNQYQVTEKAMDASFKQHQSDPEVQQAIQNMRMLSAATPQARGAPAIQQQQQPSRSSSGAGAVAIPESLNKDRLREIMTYAAPRADSRSTPLLPKLSSQRGGRHHHAAAVLGGGAAAAAAARQQIASHAELCTSLTMRASRAAAHYTPHAPYLLCATRPSLAGAASTR